MTQEISWVITIVFVGMLALLFLYFASSASKSSEEYAPIQKSAYSLRSKMFFLILLVIVPIVGYTLTKMPYPTNSTKSEASKTVAVIGHQWYWEINDLSAKVGEPVLYEVTSADVNHGFGIYDPDLNIISQTQAMPKYKNNLLVSFPKAGVYKIMCLEYCGLVHHAMITEINVTE